MSQLAHEVEATPSPDGDVYVCRICGYWGLSLPPLPCTVGRSPEAIHVIWDDDDGQWCDHPSAAVISDVSGDHFCAVCNEEWWEDPL